MTQRLLSNGLVYLIDEADAHLVDNGKAWHAQKGRRTTYAFQSSPRKLFMHRLIMGAAPGQVVDHINGNGLDNKRENLRLCSVTQNNQNSRPSRRSKTEGPSIKGAYLARGSRAKPWWSKIVVNKKQISLGYFATPEEAGAAYDAAARQYFGEFARTNGDSA